MNPLRVVMDTSVLIAALRSPAGASAEFLRLAKLGYYQLCATTALVLEYESVLLRREHLLASGLSYAKAQAALDELLLHIEPVSIYYDYRPLLADTKDEQVLQAAISARAFALVTHNVRHFREAAPSFRIRVLTPASILNIGGRA